MHLAKFIAHAIPTFGLVGLGCGWDIGGSSVPGRVGLGGFLQGLSSLAG
jgi:hypothetical protein